MHRFAPNVAQKPAVGAYSVPPNPLVGFRGKKGEGSAGKEEERKEGKGEKKGERKERKGRTERGKETLSPLFRFSGYAHACEQKPAAARDASIERSTTLAVRL